MSVDIKALSATVQHNCHISDARHARDYSLCIYLLKMREYYRWEKGFGYEDELPARELGDWLQEREQLWHTLESQPFHAISLDGKRIDPFDNEAINRQLVPQGLIYSGGFGRYAKPHFFIGRLLRKESRAGFTVFISSEELARDLVSPPAMNLGHTVFVRRESLRRILWEKFEEWRWRKQENAMARAIKCYGFADSVDRALDEMADRETEAAVLHEIGEGLAGRLLGEDWREMLAVVSRTRAEVIARAVRDHLADCLSTLPALLTQEDKASLHFYFANLDGMRKELSPELVNAYQLWAGGSGLSALADVVDYGREYWLQAARRIIELYRTHGQECAAAIEKLSVREKQRQRLS